MRFYAELNGPAADVQSQEYSIIIGTELTYPPYSFLDKDGQTAGFNVDLTRAIAEAKERRSVS
ncbi:MAG: transporter substrate-binding domain-containing protein [Thermodesulfobacteriota bacterium]|nr:transporter substrate-binding domain-containing protein [Thermodesulfobacteriota bacterium]